MRRYLSVVSARFRLLLQYRAAAIAGLFCQTFWGLIRMMIFGAFYAASAGSQPMSYADVVTYVWLGQAMFWLLPWNVDSELQGLIRSGNVAYELVRPLDLYTFWYTRAVAWRTAPTVLRAAPMLLAAWLFFGLQPPASLSSALAWAAATLGALALSCAVTNLATICLLWTVSGYGMRVLIAPLMWLCSGMIVPLPLFPDWARAVLEVLPFRGLVDIPFRLYMGHIPVAELPAMLAHQLGWTAALVLLGRWLLSRGVRRIVVQGG